MNIKEALKILNMSQSAFAQRVKAGHVRYTVISTRRYDYNEQDVYALSNVRRTRERKTPTITTDRLTELLGLDVEALRSPKRSVRLVDQRRIVAAVMARYGFTREKIGRFLNRRHATITILLKNAHWVEKEINQALDILSRQNHGKETQETEH